MNENEICASYRNAKFKAQHIQILAELNNAENLEIITVLTHAGERIPASILNKLYRRLDTLDSQIGQREREYRAIVAAIKGEKQG